MAARKKGGAKLRERAKRSKIPPLLKRPPKNGAGKNGAGRIAKGAYEMLYGGLEAMANPLAPASNLVAGKDSPINTRNLTRRVLPGPLKKLVPGGKQLPPKPKYGAGKIGPPEKPKTWRDRMNARKNPSR